MKNKNFFTVTFLFIILISSVFGAPIDRVTEYTLENSMKVYLLEDSSDALVHIEFTTRAGFSSQTQSTCGFFKLFTRLIQASNPKLNFSEVQCNSDSSRYILHTNPLETDRILADMAETLMAPQFSDELLNSELTKLKKEISDNAESMSTYINAAIDSRVFSDAPWKNDSGIYPPLFKKTTAKTARNIIQDIAARWYIPQNSAIFISGNINSEKILLTLKQTFGKFYSNHMPPMEKPSVSINSNRKYVLHSPEISADLTQVVVQYTMLNMEETDLLAGILNNDLSVFKQKVLNIPELNIPGAEYIDVAAAHKRDSSRLIIQTLIQPPENKKLGINSLEQTQDFLEEIYNIPSSIEPAEVLYAKKQLENQTKEIFSNHSSLMQQLSAFWAFSPYYNAAEEETLLYPENILVSLLSGRANRIQNLELQTTVEKLTAEEPFVFVIINSKDYAKNKKAYTQAGFEEINQNNSSWYVQEMYKEIRDQFKPSEIQTYTGKANLNDNSYYAKNIAQFKTRTLSNGIKIISKQNPNSYGITMVLSVAGGKLNSARNNGFEEVMINLLGTIIQREISRKQFDGLILGNPQVYTETGLSTGSIYIDFEQEDCISIFQAISNAMIYSEIPPAAADRAVSSKQYRKRLENGSSANQLYSAAINSIYGNGNLSRIFDTEKDVLQTTDFTAIQEAYPALLDASRYTVIITGNFEDSIFEPMEKSLMVFADNHHAINNSSEKTNVPKNKKLNVKIRHTFLTDIPAEKAGPQPAVLIPTTEFLDPVLYISKAPENGMKEKALYNAVMIYTGKVLQNKINSNAKFRDSQVSVQLPSEKLGFACVTVSNVAHTKEADSIYKATVQEIMNRMQEPQAMQNVIQEIKSTWITSQMEETGDNRGTARLIQKGVEMFPEEPQGDFYLQEYNYIQSAGVQDYIDAMNYVPAVPHLRVYSADGKQ